MALILSIESSAVNFSVAIHQDGVCLGTEKNFTQRAAASELAPAIQQLCERLEIKLSQLRAVAISEGPGSYTGLRIGSSTAKGICMALNIPLIAVNTLRAMMWPLRNDQRFRYYCPVLDARRDEVYCMVFNDQFQEIHDTMAIVLNQNSFSEFLNEGKVLFFGSGAEKCVRITGHEHAVGDSDVIPDATAVGEVAWNYFNEGRFVSVSGFEPLYLKEFLVGTKPKA
jgi:tRNA threonylcarbamoyladenosine biosynthesis protein TsaB